MRRQKEKWQVNLPYIWRASWGLNPKGGGTVTPVTHWPCASALDLMLTPMTHQPCASASDPMWVWTCHNRYIQVDRTGQDQEWTANRTEQFALSDIIFDFQHMYISRRGDTVGPPVWKSTILHVFSKSKLSVLEAMAVWAPMTYVVPSTPSHANSYRVSGCAILHPVPLWCQAWQWTCAKHGALDAMETEHWSYFMCLLPMLHIPYHVQSILLFLAEQKVSGFFGIFWGLTQILGFGSKFLGVWPEFQDSGANFGGLSRFLELGVSKIPGFGPLNGCFFVTYLQPKFQGSWCQSTTLYAKLCIPPNISDASPHTPTHCVCTLKTVQCHIAPCICTPAHATSLFTCLFIYPCSLASHVTCLVCFLSWIASFIDRQWADTKSGFTCCIRKGPQ